MDEIEIGNRIRIRIRNRIEIIDYAHVIIKPLKNFVHDFKNI